MFKKYFFVWLSVFFVLTLVHALVKVNIVFFLIFVRRKFVLSVYFRIQKYLTWDQKYHRERPQVLNLAWLKKSVSCIASIFQLIKRQNSQVNKIGEKNSSKVFVKEAIR